MSAQDNEPVKVSVINSGSVWKTKVTSSTKVSKLISMALSHFHGSGAHSSSKSPKSRMVLVRTRGILSAEKTLGEEGLRDNDEILLVEFRVPSKPAAVDLRGPTAAEIFEATKHLETRNTDKSDWKFSATEDDLDSTERFSKDSPRIFVSLIEYAASVLAFDPNGMEIFETLKKAIASKKESVFHSPYVKQLTDMGFSEGMAVEALTTKKMNISGAIEYLLEKEPTAGQTDYKEGPSTSHSQPLSVFDAFQELLHSVLKKKQENFKVCSKLVLQLKQMGYEEKDVERVLTETDNNLRAAISYLRDKAGTKISWKSPLHLDPNGSIYKAMMASEIIQLNLKKPKFLLALFSILEDPQSLSLWLKDRDISSILNHLILIYNTETSGGRCIA